MNFELERKSLVERMKSECAVKSKEVENSFLAVKRELFVNPSMQNSAYADDALPLIKGQTISQPSTIAAMLENLQVRKDQKVLEIGSGCGYVLALLSKIAGSKGKVFGIELLPELAEISKKNLKNAGVKNAKVFCADGSKGLSEQAPFDRILISAACAKVPDALVEQLAEGGILVAPVGAAFSQQLEILEKKNGELLQSFAPGFYVFVPLKFRE